MNIWLFYCSVLFYSSIADSVSKRRRQKQETQEPAANSTSNEEETKTPDTPQGKKHSCDKCGRVFSKWKHLSIHYTKVKHKHSNPLDHEVPFFTNIF